MSVRKSWKNYRQIYGKSKASLYIERYAYDNPLLCRFSLQLVFFSEQPFYGNYSTLDSHTNTVISHTFAHSSRWRRKPWQGLLMRETIFHDNNEIKNKQTNLCTHVKCVMGLCYTKNYQPLFQQMKGNNVGLPFS